MEQLSIFDFIRKISIGAFLKRKHDNEIFYITRCNKDSTYLIRHYDTNRIYGKFTTEQIDNIFIII